jgi:hypothetical protein
MNRILDCILDGNESSRHCSINVSDRSVPRSGPLSHFYFAETIHVHELLRDVRDEIYDYGDSQCDGFLSVSPQINS